MAIHQSGTFDYRVLPIQSDTAGELCWRGKAISLRDSSEHPGLVGLHPDFELRNGWITLSSVRSADSTSCPGDEKSPAQTASFQVGQALALALQDGDTLCVRRSGTGDRGFWLSRNGRLVLAVGAIVDLPLGRDIAVQNVNRYPVRELLTSLITFWRWGKFRPSPPKDVLISIQETEMRLGDGEEAFAGPYYAYVGRTFIEGFPGEESIVGIAWLSNR
ncbi:MAG TPA: hypothetical protein VNV88_14610, partial [Candidatus Solibacter sp.]|nr:hypothetical protein [Candidatus Solibacter sp.]